MSMIMSAEHDIHTCLVQNRNKHLVRLLISIPASFSIESRNMHDCHLYRSLGEQRVLDSFLEPLDLLLAEKVEINCS